MMKKLKSKKGFSLSELLMVVMILALLVSIIGGGVMVVKTAYEKITLKAEAQVLMSTTITKVKDEFRYAQMIGEGDSPSFQSGNIDGSVSIIRLKNAEEEGERGIILCYEDKRTQLLTDKTMSAGLSPQMTYSFDETSQKFHATIDILHGEGADAKVILTQEITVNPINGTH